MKRPHIVALIIGGIVAAIISALLAKGLLLPLERAIDGFASRHATLTRQVAAPWHYVLVTLLCFGVAWVTLMSKRVDWVRWTIAILLIELITIPCVCALNHVFFQPLPSLLAAALSFGLALGFRILGRGDRARRAEEIFSAHVSKEQLDRLIGGGQPLEEPATVHETSVLTCDLAQKYERVEDSSPKALSAMVDEFVRFARDILLKEGAYVHTADGEGVVGIFGFPVSDDDHALTAATAALRLVRGVRKSCKKRPKACSQIPICISGSVPARSLPRDLSMAPKPRSFRSVSRWNCRAVFPWPIALTALEFFWDHKHFN